MKMLNVLLMLTLGATTGAQGQTVKINDQVLKIQTDRQGGKLNLAMAEAAQLISDMYQGLGVGQVIARVNTAMTEIRDEVVVSSYTKRNNASLGASLLGLLSLRANYKSYNYYDVTKIITRNPEEVAQFPSRVENELNRLRSDLLKYINKNADRITLMKYLGILYFQMVNESSDANEPIYVDEFARILGLLDTLNFLGEQTVTACVATNHANWRKTDDWSAGAALRILFISLNAGGGRSSEEIHHAYTEGTCQSTVNQVQVSQGDMVWNVNLTRVDSILKEWAAVASLKVQLAPGSAPLFPTFNSPYYK